MAPSQCVDHQTTATPTYLDIIFYLLSHFKSYFNSLFSAFYHQSIIHIKSILSFAWFVTSSGKIKYFSEWVKVLALKLIREKGGISNK